MASPYDTPVLPSQKPPPPHVQKMIDEVVAMKLPGDSPRRATAWNAVKRFFRSMNFFSK